MPRPTVPDGLYISVSQIKCWLKCPRQYVLKYVRGIEPAFVPTAFAFGSAFHAAVAAFYLELRNTGEPLQRSLAFDVFRDAWEHARSGRIPLQADEDEDRDLSVLADKGIAMVDVFLDHVGDRIGHQQVEAVEHSFAVPIHDPDTGELLEEQLVGTVDALIREDGRRVLLEHKTAARRYTADQLRYDPQPTAYRYAARILELGNVGVRYQIVTKATMAVVQVEDVVRGERDEDDLLRTALGVLRSVDSGVDYPIRGWQCRTCPFSYKCR